jgi:hypothetical protein
MTDVTTAVAPRVSGRWARLRARFRLVYVAPILALVALLAWTVASPMGSAPDDDYHLDSIWCGNPLNTDACSTGSEPGTRLVPEGVTRSPCYAQQPETSGVCQTTEISLDPADKVQTDRGNFLGQYPPVFYSVMSLLVGPDILTSVWLMRLVTVLLFVGITTALALLLPMSRRVPLIVGWIISTVPLGIFLLASNNPSSWALIGVGSSWMALVGYFETTGKRRVALGAVFGLTALMAAGSRTDAAIYIVIGIGVAIWLTFRRGRSYLLLAVLPLAFAVLAAVFYLTSGQSSVAVGGLGGGTLQPEVPDGSHAPRSGLALIAYNLLQVPQLWVGAFGFWGLGWLDTTLPAVVWVGAAAVFGGVLFAGLKRLSWRTAIPVIGVGLVLWILPTYVLVAGGNVVGENVQPRYLLPLIVLLGMLVLLPATDRLPRVSWLQLVVVGAALVVANAFALHVDIRRYVTGIDVASPDLNAGAEWVWPGAPAPMVTWILGSLAYAGLLAVLGREVVKRGVVRSERAI